ncbi:hypothetical protein BJ138DRAFT_998127 [Hygrophoropsis aurantiaca]|uniref:Uncharacterized protein n=1 Tax=Hygrophoropsis aurantiaca TaxID=72124 RepID=A0ACB8AQW6_9AGAM|nr:hypothetical protein BJ138DRAFT_998127 [Hygrophoropsis aurantiaca]
MGGYDQLCIVCGVAPSGGPSQLFTDPDDEVEHIAEKIVSDILLADPSQDYSAVFDIVQDALLQTDEVQWLPDGIRDWSGFQNCVAIGYFDNEDGAASLFPDKTDGNPCFPNGSKVQLRCVSGGSAGGFTSILGDGQTKEECLTHCTSRDSRNPNFFVSEACYHYLEEWIDRTALPSQRLSVPHTPNLTFAGELYEIVNSRAEGRERLKGLLPCIDYGGIEDTCEQYQDNFQPNRQGCKHIAAGINEGLSEENLLPHIIRDFQCWMFMRPDRWPSPTAEEVPQHFTRHNEDINKAETLFDKLSAQLLLTIARELPVPSYLALSATCGSLRRRLTESVLLNRVLKEMIAVGSLQWVRPVNAMPGELENATSIDKEWLSTVSDNEGSLANNESVILDGSKGTSVFQSANFPYFTFVHACFTSDSMNNRRRLWENTKQFERLWKAFRLYGWEVDRFHH